MTKRTWLAIFLTSLMTDLACLVFARHGSWLVGFGARGLVFDFVFAIIVLVKYNTEDASS